MTKLQEVYDIDMSLIMIDLVTLKEAVNDLTKQNIPVVPHLPFLMPSLVDLIIDVDLQVLNFTP